MLGLDPGGLYSGGKPTAARMGDVRLADLIPHLSDVPVVLPVWVLQEI